MIQAVENSGSTINDMKILIIGCGGVGSELITGLCTYILNYYDNQYGKFDINIVDPDVMEVTNHNRQYAHQFLKFEDGNGYKYKALNIASSLYLQKSNISMNDAVEQSTKEGEWDVTKCVSYIGTHASDDDKFQLNPHVTYFENMPIDFITNHDILISCVDNVETRRNINMVVTNHNTKNTTDSLASTRDLIHLIDTGSTGFLGSLRYICPPMTSCYECSLSTLDSQTDIVPICSPRVVFGREADFEKLIVYILSNSMDEDKTDIEKIQRKCMQLLEKQTSSGFNTDPNLIQKIQNINNIQNAVDNHTVIPSCVSINSIIANRCLQWIMSIFNNEKIQSNFVFYSGLKGSYFNEFEFRKLSNCSICGCS